MTVEQRLGRRVAPSEPFPELRAGNLGVRVAVTPAEIDAVQALRYRVFYRELGATADVETARSNRDRDRFDSIADHLLVIDHAIGPGAEGVVGTYRLIQREAAAQLGRFYSADEYDIAPILGFPGRIMELGRSCVDVAYRNRAAMQLLWRGIAAYVFHYQIDLMFGCASLPGTDPDAPGGGTHLSLPEPSGASRAAAARAAASLRGDAAIAARVHRSPAGAGATAAADQRLPATRRLRRGWRGDRPSSSTPRTSRWW